MDRIYLDHAATTPVNRSGKSHVALSVRFLRQSVQYSFLRTGSQRSTGGSEGQGCSLIGADRG
jgi:hypothetical protein